MRNCSMVKIGVSGTGDPVPPPPTNFQINPTLGTYLTEVPRLLPDNCTIPMVKDIN